MDNSTIESERAAVIDEIALAFDGVSREDGTTLHEAEAIDGYASEEEQLRARQLDTDTRWQDVPPQEIQVASCADPPSWT